MKKLLLSLSLVAVASTINAQWTAQGTGFSAASRGLSEIRIVDANTVWALAYDGGAPVPPATTGANIQEFTQTTSAGASWSSGIIDVSDPTKQITNISPVSATTAWAGAVDSANGGGGVFKTSNSGGAWTAQNATAYTTVGTLASYFDFVHFFDANIGITVGDPIGAGVGEFEVYRTINGGTTWTAVAAASLPNPLTGEYGYTGGYVASGDSMWFTTNKGRLYRTIDKGVTWNAYQAPLSDFGAALPANSGAVDFSSPSNGCLLKTSGTTATPVYTFYTTSNGGQTWSAGTPFSGTRRILTYVPGTTTIVATSQSAPVGTSVSSDNGATWTDLEPTGTTQRGASAFLNATTGWCAGFSGMDPLTGGIFKFTGTLANQSFATTKFSIYPNPASSNITIAAPQTVSDYKLKVTDLTGKVISSNNFNGIENTIDISSFAKGLYFFEINSGIKTETIKILKN